MKPTQRKTKMTRIIETDTIEAGDFVAFMAEGVEMAGVAKGFNDSGEIDVFRGNGITYSVAHECVTDIMAMS